MKPKNRVYVGGPPLDPPDDLDLPMVCTVCHGRGQIPFYITYRKRPEDRRWKDCPNCCDDL